MTPTKALIYSKSPNKSSPWFSLLKSTFLPQIRSSSNRKRHPSLLQLLHSLATACNFSLESHCHVSTSHWSSKPLTWFLTNQPCMDTWLLEIVTLGKIKLQKMSPKWGSTSGLLSKLMFKIAPLNLHQQRSQFFILFVFTLPTSIPVLFSLPICVWFFCSKP